MQIHVKLKNGIAYTRENPRKELQIHVKIQNWNPNICRNTEIDWQIHVNHKSGISNTCKNTRMEFQLERKKHKKLEVQIRVETPKMEIANAFIG